MSDDGWSDLELRSAWTDVARAPDAKVVAASIRRAERSRTTLHLVRTAVALAAVGGLVAAMMHAVNTLEALLAIAVGVAIVVSWFVATSGDRRQLDLLPGPADAYAEARLRVLRSERRLFRFIWLVLGLDLLFMVPWLATGIGLHLPDQPGVRTLLLLWLPLIGLVAFVAWSMRRMRFIRQELELLERVDAAG